MRESVEKFLELGTLPPNTAAPDVIGRHQEALHAIARPLSLEEANALVNCFGPDDCFGLSFTLVHLIETAPFWESKGIIPQGTQPELQRLRTGIQNAQQLKG